MPSQLLAHRGDWSERHEQNSLAAIDRAFAAGFGVETDLRDCAGEIVVSHDPPRGSEPRLHDLLELHAHHGGRLPMALNVKADGLASQIADGLTEGARASSFFFDMSVPDTVAYLRLGLPVFGRQSELEPEATFSRQSAGVWLDAFHDDWAEPEVVTAHLSTGKRVALVAPELHGRDPGRRWSALLHLLDQYSDVLVCTDHPHRLLEMSA